MKKIGVLVDSYDGAIGWFPRLGTDCFQLPYVFELLRGKREDAGWNLHAETE